MNTLVRWSQTSWSARKPLRVMHLGLRGFPNVQGGVENHAENLSLRLAELGCDVEVIFRSPYVPRACRPSLGNIKLVRLWAPRIKGVEALVHTLLGVLRAAWTRPDVLHLHAVGPALFTPLARALGLRVVVTHHVLNYENEKWGFVGRAILRLGERVGMRFANGRIAVSQALADRIERSYRVPVEVIPNGIDDPQKILLTPTLAEFGLLPRRYVLTVARIDQQKRQLDLIEAFARAGRPPWKLAIVGGADYSSKYASAVAQAARNTEGVVLLGRQTGAALAELYTYAGVFALPSTHEGQPIAVLEAMSFGCAAILSDIPAHREIGGASTRFVPIGDVTALAGRLEEIFCATRARRLDGAERERLMKTHDWRQIARRTLDVYLAALPGATGAVRGAH
jgi:glycosyltransferase involved in cell wall biosynthesis